MISILQVDVELFYQTWHHPNLLLQRKKEKKKIVCHSNEIGVGGSYFYTQLSFFRLFRHIFFFFFNHKFTCDFTLGARKYSSVQNLCGGGRRRQMMETTSTHANEENVNQQKTHRPETNWKKKNLFSPLLLFINQLITFTPPPSVFKKRSHPHNAKSNSAQP